MVWHSITSTDNLADVLSEGASSGSYTLILKHSVRCALSSMAKVRLERDPDPRINYYVIDVLSHRNVSDALTDQSGVRHESPQAFLFQGDRLLEVKSHLAISRAELTRRINLLAQI